VPPLPGPPGLVLIPESGAPLLGIVALCGAVGVDVVVASVSVTVVVDVDVCACVVAEVELLSEPQAASANAANSAAVTAIRLIGQ
jgi:hypothetical protein